MRVSKAFISGSGLTAERGLSTTNMLSASVDRALVQSAAEVIVLADHTKLGTDTMFQTVPTDAITRLVTDEHAAGHDPTARELDALADCGVQIAIAPLGLAAEPPGHPGPERHPQQQPPGAARRAAGAPSAAAPLPGQRRPGTHGGPPPGHLPPRLAGAR